SDETFIRLSSLFTQNSAVVLPNLKDCFLSLFAPNQDHNTFISENNRVHLLFCPRPFRWTSTSDLVIANQLFGSKICSFAGLVSSQNQNGACRTSTLILYESYTCEFNLLFTLADMV